MPSLRVVCARLREFARLLCLVPASPPRRARIQPTALERGRNMLGSQPDLPLADRALGPAADPNGMFPDDQTGQGVMGRSCRARPRAATAAAAASRPAGRAGLSHDALLRSCNSAMPGLPGTAGASHAAARSIPRGSTPVRVVRRWLRPLGS